MFPGLQQGALHCCPYPGVAEVTVGGDGCGADGIIFEGGQLGHSCEGQSGMFPGVGVREKAQRISQASCCVLESAGRDR